LFFHPPVALRATGGYKTGTPNGVNRQGMLFAKHDTRGAGAQYSLIFRGGQEIKLRLFRLLR
jgi:hypothetical protein